MYTEYWQLTDKPFENTSDARFFFPSAEHEEALMRLVYCITEHKAGAVLVGDYGTGKTTVVYALLDRFANDQQYSFIYITNPLLEAQEFLKEIVYRLQKKVLYQASKLELQHALEDCLRKNVEAKKHTILLIDEAHLIQAEKTWEELRLLLNFYNNEKFFLTLILVGQLPLVDSLSKLGQFKQRLSVRYKLAPLDENATRKYINHRLHIAGCKRPIFTKEAIKWIFLHSHGSPREINNICDLALLVGYSKKVKKIGGKIIEEVVKDLDEAFYG